MEILKTILSILAIPFGIKGKVTDEATDNGICDFSGQGKSKNGRGLE